MTIYYKTKIRLLYFISETRWFKKLKRKIRIPEVFAWIGLTFLGFVIVVLFAINLFF